MRGAWRTGWKPVIRVGLLFFAEPGEEVGGV
jgi:hypothetical protein